MTLDVLTMLPNVEDTMPSLKEKEKREKRFLEERDLRFGEQLRVYSTLMIIGILVLLLLFTTF